MFQSRVINNWSLLDAPSMEIRVLLEELMEQIVVEQGTDLDLLPEEEEEEIPLGLLGTSLLQEEEEKKKIEIVPPLKGT